ncbi:MAG: hypothetical protein JWN21_990 [Sphingomonas bacterium]|uniref:hypothetical protein n=1 Tax=Sphingomonas bacterium TaxID=1895847 RepID=UPI00261A2CB2|nr:hypothetical protein [Sphingomonas bacterium]MDB5695447.1 hypothetical protein [Sphingomonas bacterium]
METDTLPYLASTRPHDDAGQLIARFGAHAGDEAACRAERSRRIGNHLHFCRWREVGRLIATLGATRTTGTLH